MTSTTPGIRLDIRERELDSGLRLLAIRNEGVQTFAAGVVFDVDVRDEVAGEEGLASLVGDCLDEGTVQRTDVELAEAADEIGGTISCHGSGGTVMSPDKHREPAVALLREVVSEPRFADREVRRVQDEVLQEIRVEEADPRTVANLRFREEVYGKHPYGRPGRGSAESVDAFAPTDLHRFHGAWFGAHKSYVAAAGPGDPDATLEVLAAAFGDLPGGALEHTRPDAPAMPEPGVDIHLPMEREQVHVFMGHPGIRRQNPDFYALCVMDYILGTGPGFTSRISRRLRDEQGLCYSVNAAISGSSGEEPGCFAAYIGTSAEHRQKAVAGFLVEIDRIRQELVEEKELADVVQYLTGSYVFAFERNTQLAGYAIRAKRFDLGLDHMQKYPDLIRSVTREDVQRVAQKYLLPDRMVRVSAGAS